MTARARTARLTNPGAASARRWPLEAAPRRQRSSWPSLSRGLVARWACDDAGAGTVEDAHGRASLAVTGSVPLVAGVDGTARQFRQAGGVAEPAVNYAEAAADATLLEALRGSYTVAFWARRAAGAAADNQAILEVRPATDPSDAEAYNLLLSVSYYVDGRLSVGWEHSGGVNVGGLHAIPVAVGEWQHVAVVVTRTGANAALDVYTDGLYRASDAELGATGGTSGMRVLLGAGGSNTGGRNAQLHADLDDVRVYNRALSERELQLLAGVPELLARWRLDEGADVTGGMLHRWRCDDDEADLEDDIGGLTLALTGSAPLAAGMHGSARQFRQPGAGSESTNRAMANAPDSLLDVLRDGTYTVTAWVKRLSGAVQTFAVLLDVAGDPSGDYPTEVQSHNRLLEAWLTNATGELTVAWEHGAGTGVSCTSAAGLLPADTWAHLAIRKTPGELELLVDGVLAESWDGLTDADGGTTSMRVTVGYQHRAVPAYYAFPLHADVDDIRVYGRALSDAEVAALAGLAALDMTDDTGRATLSPSGGPLPLDEGKLGRCRRFWGDGLAGTQEAWCYGESGALDGTELEAGMDGSFTACGWVWLDESTPLGHHCALFLGTDSDDLLTLEVEVVDSQPPVASGHFRVGWDGGLTTAATLTAGEWHHICARYDARTETLEAVIDGEAAQSEAQWTRPAWAAGSTVVLGAARDGGLVRQWFGNLDDWRLYSRALSDEEVAELLLCRSEAARAQVLNPRASAEPEE